MQGFYQATYRLETTDHDGSDDIHRKSLRAPIGSHEVIRAGC